MRKSTNVTAPQRLRQGELHTFTSRVERNEPIEIVSRNGWVKWGDDNLQPQLYNSLAYDNAIHGGIINQKVNFITAGGLAIEGVTGVESEILSNYNSAYSLEEVIQANSNDFEMCNQFYVLWKKNLKGNWIASYMENSLIRVDEKGSFFHYSEDWSTDNQNPDKTSYRTIKSIHKVDLENDMECLMQVQERPKQRIVKNKAGKSTVTSGFYPVPTYSGALNSIKAGIKMSFFVYSEVVNGFKGGTWINLANGIPATAEEETAIVRKIKSEATNEDLMGGIVVSFSEGKEREPRISQINGNDLDKRYSTTKKDVLNEIMIAHGVISQALFGVMSDSLFGSREELETAYTLFKNSYVKKRQRTILEAYNWAEEKLNGFKGEIVFNDYSLGFEEEVIEEVSEQEIAMKFDTDVIALFEACGVDKNSFEIKHSESYKGLSNDEFKANYLKSKFAVELTEEQEKILGLIREGQPYQAISKAIGKGGVYLSKQLITLGNLGVITDNGGLKVTAEAPPQEIELKVMYSYELRSNAPALVGDSSRPFCKRLVELNRLYTIEEINQISIAIDRDVWSYRGGWYHNPETEVNTPSCRHEWRQIIV